jgi:hypothetical protein
MSNQLLIRLQNKYGKIKTGRSGDGHVEFKLCCPFPHSKHRDTNFHLYVNPAKGVYRCWSCGRRGRVADLIEANDLEFQQPVEKVVAVTDVDSLRRVPEPFDGGKGGGLIPVDQLPADHPAIVYLTRIRKRPFDPQELARTFGVFYCNIGRVFGKGTINYDTTNTLIFPVYWRDHRPPYRPMVIGWQSRLLYDPAKLSDAECSAYGLQRNERGEWIRPPKYFTSPGLDKGRALYNYLNARNHSFVVVTEGVFDAFSVGPSAVCLFGKTPTEYQLNLIKTYWSDVILLLDPDARKEMWEAFGNLSRSVRVTSVLLEGHKDAGDMSREEIWRQIAKKIEADQRYSRAAIAGLNLEALTN